MLDQIYSTPRALERARRSWLKNHIDRFVDNGAKQGCCRATLLGCANRLLRFGEFLELQGVREMAHLPQWVERFLAQHYPRDPARGICRSTVSRFLGQLVREGAIPAPEPSGTTVPHANLVEEYAEFLCKHRGLSRMYLDQIRHTCMALLAHLSSLGGVDLKLVQPEDIHRFLVAEGERRGRTTLSGTCSMLRGFLSHLYRHRMIATDVSSTVVTPRIYKPEQCPRFLTWAEIDKVLAVIDRNTSLGSRDYAMLLLLAVYGLRGIEVVRLQLDDLDWRSQRLHIRRRKAGNRTIYPLAVPVGEAVVAYLRSGRPKSTHREVFLANIAPFGPLSCGTLGMLSTFLRFTLETRPVTYSSACSRCSACRRLAANGRTNALSRSKTPSRASGFTSASAIISSYRTANRRSMALLLSVDSIHGKAMYQMT